MFGLSVIEFVLFAIMTVAAIVALGGGAYLFFTREQKRQKRREKLNAYWLEVIAVGKRADKEYRRANGRFRQILTGK